MHDLRRDELPGPRALIHVHLVPRQRRAVQPPGVRLLAGLAGAILALTLAGSVGAHEGGTVGIDVVGDRVPPGATVSLVGEDWAPREPLRIELVASGRSFDLGIVLAGSDGHFLTTMMIPAEAPAGPAFIDARSERGVIERAIFAIDPAAPRPAVLPMGAAAPVAGGDGVDPVPFVAVGLAVAGLSVLLLRTRRAAPRL